MAIKIMTEHYTLMIFSIRYSFFLFNEIGKVVLIWEKDVNVVVPERNRLVRVVVLQQGRKGNASNGNNFL